MTHLSEQHAAADEEIFREIHALAERFKSDIHAKLDDLTFRYPLDPRVVSYIDDMLLDAGIPTLDKIADTVSEAEQEWIADMASQRADYEYERRRDERMGW